MSLSGFPVTVKARDVVFFLWNLQQICHLLFFFFLSGLFEVNFVNFHLVNNTNYFLLEALP